jgi:hypothetical protein
LIAGEADLIALSVIHSQSIRIVQSVPPESRGLSSTRRTRPPDSDFVKLIGEVVSAEHRFRHVRSMSGLELISECLLVVDGVTRMIQAPKRNLNDERA